MNIHSWRPSGRGPTTPRGLKPAKRSPTLTAVAALLLVGVAGCGDEPTNSAKSGRKDPGSAAGEPTSRPSTDTATHAAKPDPRALGIDMAQWPRDRKEVQALLDRMPDRLAGKPMKGSAMIDGPYAQVSYGPANKGGITVSATSPDKEVKDPRTNLSVTFGLGSVCSRESYVGTAPYLKGATSRWGIPGSEATGASAPDDLWWFACDFMAGEDRTFTGHAIGWVNDDIAWLVTTPDKATSKATIAAMESARSVP